MIFLSKKNKSSLLILLVSIYTLISIFLSNISTINSQEEDLLTSELEDSLIISPPFQPLTVGNSYNLLIQNNSNESRIINITEKLFKFSPETKLLLKTDELNNDNYLEFSESQIEINANSSVNVQVTKIKEPDELYAGIVVSSVNESATNIGTEIELASVTYNNLFNSDDLREIDIVYELKTTENFPGNITFNPNFIYDLDLKNNSNKFISASGEVTSETNRIKLRSEEITSELGRFLLPRSETNISQEININNYPQDFWQYLFPQKIDFSATITYDRAISIKTDPESAWYIHPFAIIFWFVILITIIFGLFFGLKRFTSHSRIS